MEKHLRVDGEGHAEGAGWRPLGGRRPVGRPRLAQPEHSGGRGAYATGRVSEGGVNDRSGHRRDGVRVASSESDVVRPRPGVVRPGRPRGDCTDSPPRAVLMREMTSRV